MKTLWLAVVLVLVAQGGHAQAPVVRAHLEPGSNIIVGQPVRLVVSVFVPNYFTGAPEFPEFEMENAIVVLPQDRAENSNTQINGKRYAGITQTYVIYPQQAGEFHVPPAKLSVPYAIAPPQSTTVTPSLPMLSFHAEVPAAARSLPYFLPTTRLTLAERWSRPLKNLQTGDSIERTITVTASKMQAMLIPPLPHDQPDGLRVYPGEPLVHDQKTARGEFIYGQRVETAKYLIQKTGSYTLPPIQLQWWDLSTHRLATAVLPATTFSAVANPTYKAELPPPQIEVVAAVEKGSLWQRYRTKVRFAAWLVVGAIAFALFVWLLRLAFRNISKRWRYWKSSESARFLRLLRAAYTNKARPAYASLLQWSGMAFPGVPMQEAVQRSGDQDLIAEVEVLAASLYGTTAADGSGWKGSRLAGRLKWMRRNRRNKGYLTASRKRLSALNPVACSHMGSTCSRASKTCFMD
jgi:hypothetical protein